MSQLTASPYINFRGQAREAFVFYQQALGGEVTLLAGDNQNPPKLAGPDDGVMHGVLISGDIMIMGSDGHPDYPPTVGDNMAIVVSGDDIESMRAIFDKLSAGGTIKQALKTEIWGDTFGYFVDKFSINWMLNVSVKQ